MLRADLPSLPSLAGYILGFFCLSCSLHVTHTLPAHFGSLMFFLALGF